MELTAEMNQGKEMVADVFVLRPPTVDRYSTQYDGTEIIEVRDAKIVEKFVGPIDGDPYNFALTAVLFKVKTKGFKFNMLVEMDEDHDGPLWLCDMTTLNTTIDEVMILTDYMQNELNALNGGKKVRLMVESKYDSPSSGYEEDEEDEDVEEDVEEAVQV